MNTEKLWDIKQLIEHYPAFKLYGVRHLIRHRAIPICRIGKRIYFRPDRIEEWVTENEINVSSDKKIKLRKRNTRR